MSFALRILRLLALPLVCMGAAAQATPVNIPDARFQACLNQHLNRADDHALDSEDFKKLPSALLCHERAIRSVEGLQYASELEEIYLFSNVLEELPDLSTLKKLKLLSLDNNQLQRLELNNLTALREVYAVNNRIDRLVLEKLPALKTLELGKNHISEVYAEGDNHALLALLFQKGGLFLYENRLKNIPAFFAPKAASAAQHAALPFVQQRSLIHVKANANKRYPLSDLEAIHDIDGTTLSPRCLRDCMIDNNWLILQGNAPVLVYQGKVARKKDAEALFSLRSDIQIQGSSTGGTQLSISLPAGLECQQKGQTLNTTAQVEAGETIRCISSSSGGFILQQGGDVELHEGNNGSFSFSVTADAALHHIASTHSWLAVRAKDLEIKCSHDNKTLLTTNTHAEVEIERNNNAIRCYSSRGETVNWQISEHQLLHLAKAAPICINASSCTFSPRSPVISVKASLVPPISTSESATASVPLPWLLWFILATAIIFAYPCQRRQKSLP